MGTGNLDQQRLHQDEDPIEIHRAGSGRGLTVTNTMTVVGLALRVLTGGIRPMVAGPMPRAVLVRYLGARLDRPGSFFRARMCGVHRQPGDTGTGQEQHKGRESGAPERQAHGGEDSYVDRGGKGFRNGQGGIRTREGLAPPHAFQACALSHSATRPYCLRGLNLRDEAWGW